MQLIAPHDAPILEIVTLLFPASSKTTIRSWIKDGRVTIDGVTAKQANDLVRKGQTVVFGEKIKLVNNKLKIIYEDQHLIAIEKPSGLLSVSTSFEKGDTVHAMLKAHFYPRKIFVVHRIDQDTSGVMLFALSHEAYTGLKELFAKHKIERLYCAIVEGHPDPATGTWESYVYEDDNYFVHSTQDPTRGAKAISHYRTTGSSSRYSRLALNLETGRKNQIRVHCQEHEHSVVGDKKYGSSCDPLKRLCLHAQRIVFEHPILNKTMSFESPPPDTFARLAREEHA
jgi:23S rRNA pseudouridine1911/1915/1917 synthase